MKITHSRKHLVHTAPDLNSQIVEQRSRFYELPKAGSVENALYVDNSYKWAGGGFLSTAEDLVRFGSALLQPGILNPQSLKTMFNSQKTTSGEETGCGIGWGIAKTPSGGSVGGTSQLIVYPDSHVVVALATNLSGDTWKTEEVEAVAEAFEAIKK